MSGVTHSVGRSGALRAEPDKLSRAKPPAANAALIATCRAFAQNESLRHHNVGETLNRASDVIEMLLTAMEGVMDILSRAESNASGNPEWDYVGPRVAAFRAAIAKAEGR